MKVVHIITGLGTGGAEGVLLRFVTGDPRNKHIVFSLSDEGTVGEKLRKGRIEVVALGLTKSANTWRGIWTLFVRLRQEKPDVVQTWMVHADVIGGVVARLAGIKKVFWGVRNSNYPFKINKKSTLLFVAVASIMSWFVPKKIVSCAESAATQHQKIGFRRDKFVVINNGFEFQRLETSAIPIPKDPKSKETAPVVGCIARFHPQKDHRTLLEALGIAKSSGLDFRVLLVGPAMEEGNEQLMAWVREFNLESETTLIGPQDRLGPVIKLMKINVLSSCAGEAFPNVLVEAMSNGVPCIATNVGDAQRIIGDSGWIVPPSNPFLLSAAIEAALTEPHEAFSRRSTQAAKSVRHRYPLQRMISQYLGVYSE